MRRVLKKRPPRRSCWRWLKLPAYLLGATYVLLIVNQPQIRRLPPDSYAKNAGFFWMPDERGLVGQYFDFAPAAFAGNGNGNGGGKGNAGGNGNGNAGGNGNGNAGGNGNGNAGGNGNGNAGGNGNGSAGGNANSNAGGLGKAKGKPAATTSDATTNTSITGLDGEPAIGGAVTGGHGDLMPSEVLVVDGGPDSLEQLRQLGFKLIEQRELPALHLSVLRLRTPGNLDSLRGLALLQTAMPELIADVDALYQPYLGQGADLPQTELATLPGIDYAWRLIGWTGGPDCGVGLRIGMIDSSVAADIPTLAARKLHQQSFVPSGEAATDTRHGTAIASLLVGQGGGASHPHWQGLLPSADLYAAAVFQQWGSRSMASAVAIAEALDWMAANHVSVINISLSGEPNLLIAAAVSHIAARGGVMVAAAGNGGPTAPPAYPGAYRDVIAVTAVDQNAAIFQEANRGDYIDFAAPGVRIWAPGGGSFGQYLTGTSFAAPFVTAAAALAVANSGGDPAVLRRQLAARAFHLGPPGKNSIYGYGLLKAVSACSIDTDSTSTL